MMSRRIVILEVSKIDLDGIVLVRVLRNCKTKNKSNMLAKPSSTLNLERPRPRLNGAKSRIESIPYIWKKD